MRFGENNIFYIKAEKKIIVLARPPPSATKWRRQREKKDRIFSIANRHAALHSVLYGAYTFIC